jgi:hypothetical protein
VDLDVLAVEPLERSLPRVLEEDQDGEDLGGVQPGRSSTAALSRRHEFAVPQRLTALPKRLHRAKQVEYTQSDVSSAG